MIFRRNDISARVFKAQIDWRDRNPNRYLPPIDLPRGTTGRWLLWLCLYTVILSSWAILMQKVASPMPGLSAAEYWAALCLSADNADPLALFAMCGLMSAAMMLPTFVPALRVFEELWSFRATDGAGMWCSTQGIEPSFLIRDADTKFSVSFYTVWASEGARVIQIPHRAPDANAFAESFIGTIKRECLDFFVCFSRSQLNYIVRTWVRHYNTERPHRGRGIGNNVLQVDSRPVRDGAIRRNRQLGGIVTSYTRDAA